MAKQQNDVELIAFNIISAGTNIEGTFSSEGNVRIDGKFIGNIDIAGKLILGSTGSIHGEIRCRTAEIEGSVKANIFVQELFSLKSTAKFVGDVCADKIAVEQGAMFIGHCKMSTEE